MAKEVETRSRRAVAPAADICEEAGSVVLRLEMPGVGKDDLEIRIENDEMIIQGRRKDVEEKGAYLVRERDPADYLKRYTLDETIDREKVEAVMKNGILMLTLHLKESSKPRKIEIKAK